VRKAAVATMGNAKPAVLAAHVDEVLVKLEP